MPEIDAPTPNDPSFYQPTPMQDVGGQQVPQFQGPGHAIIGTRQIDMPVQTKNPTLAEYDAHQAALVAPLIRRRQEQEEADMMRMAQESARVEGSHRAIEQAANFMAIRGWSRDVADMKAANPGMSDATAAASTLIRNPKVFRLLPAAAVSGILRTGAQASLAPLGGVQILNDPATGKRLGVAARTGAGSLGVHWDAPAKEAVTSSTQLTAADKEIADIDLQLSNVPGRRVGDWVAKEDRPEYKQLVAERATLVARRRSLAKGIAPAAGEVAPMAAPASAQRVVVISPNGKRGTIPESQLESALAHGYKQP